MSAARTAPLEAAGDHVRVHLKVVPGGSRDALLGRHGDRIRVKVAAPPEGGKANKAIVRLVAEALGVPKHDVEILRGHATPLKTVAVRGADIEAVGRVLYGVRP